MENISRDQKNVTMNQNCKRRSGLNYDPILREFGKPDRGGTYEEYSIGTHRNRKQAVASWKGAPARMNGVADQNAHPGAVDGHGETRVKLQARNCFRVKA